MKSSASESMPSQGRSEVEIPGRARQEPFQIEVGVSNRLRFRRTNFSCMKKLASKPGLLAHIIW